MSAIPRPPAGPWFLLDVFPFKHNYRERVRFVPMATGDVGFELDLQSSACAGNAILPRSCKKSSFSGQRAIGIKKEDEKMKAKPIKTRVDEG